MARLWALLRKARYALPACVGRLVPGPSAESTARRCAKLARRGFAATAGYFDFEGQGPEDVAAANARLARLLGEVPGDFYLSLKAPALAFDQARLRTVAEAAAAAGLAIMYDSHAPKDADRTLAAVTGLLADFPGTGVVLPSRWRRTLSDAAALRDSSARIRVVKGEWPDETQEEGDPSAGYIAIIERLAGRRAPVAVATHDPDLAERALSLLLAAGTPCELEQLRGLPRRRTVAVAARLGVPVRLYLPFGRGWWPYAIDKALARPYLLSWMLADFFGRRASLADDRNEMGAEAAAVAR